MDRRTQDELLEVLDALRQQVEPNGSIVPLGSVRYHPSAVVELGFTYPLELVARVFADPDTGCADLALPKVLVYDGVLTEAIHWQYVLLPAIEQAMSGPPPHALAVFAIDTDGAALEALIHSHTRKLCALAPIGCPGLEQKAASHYLHTIARISGATVINATQKEAPTWPNVLGRARRVLADCHQTILIEPAHLELAPMSARPIGLLAVGGKDARDVRESIEWLAGLLGH